MLSEGTNSSSKGKSFLLIAPIGKITEAKPIPREIKSKMYIEDLGLIKITSNENCPNANNKGAKSNKSIIS